MRDVENIAIAQAEPLAINGTTTLGRHFPLAQGWHWLQLGINITVTIGTGTGAIATGLMDLVKRILFRTDRGEICCNCNARALLTLNTYKYGTAPYQDTLAASSATYTLYVMIPFSDPRMKRMEDTILDTSRYNNVSLEITLGTVADLFTTVGTSSITASIDANVTRTREVLPPEGRPLYYISYEFAQPTNPANQVFIDIDRAPDLALKRVLTHAATSATAGASFTGTSVNTIQDRVSIKDSSSFYVQDLTHEAVQARNKDLFGIDLYSPAPWNNATGLLTGCELHSFVSDESVNTALYTGDKSKLQYVWTNQAGVGALTTPQVSLLWEGVRGLK
jgi:hypothetical protein